ncbi:unnamed protein product [Dovyalis caffra]|uniref:Maturase K n=1 Tax=Dovyalis caffra TaxID=77055 RepID=A0AAV1SN98_9ROSI|nr:unnamed protein product [Dovyalis caffra]
MGRRLRRLRHRKVDRSHVKFLIKKPSLRYDPFFIRTLHAEKYSEGNGQRYRLSRKDLMLYKARSMERFHSDYTEYQLIGEDDYHQVFFEIPKEPHIQNIYASTAFQLQIGSMTMIKLQKKTLCMTSKQNLLAESSHTDGRHYQKESSPTQCLTHQWHLNESSKSVAKNHRFWSYQLMGISLSKNDPQPSSSSRKEASDSRHCFYEILTPHSFEQMPYTFVSFHQKVTRKLI